MKPASSGESAWYWAWCALKQIKDRNQGGRGIAIAGVVLSVPWLVGFAVAIIVGASTGS